MSSTNVTEGSGTDPSVSVKAYFVTEIQSMMHGFGDARTPQLESANLIENVVQQQMKAIINHAADISAMRGGKNIAPEDIIFLLRKDRVKLHRLLKYLALKDLKNNITGTLGDAAVDPELLVEAPAAKRRKHSYLDFLSSIDQTGELTDTTNLPVDTVKYERALRADCSSRNLDDARYFEFVNARRASFVSLRSASKFREWLRMKPENSCEIPKITNGAHEVLGYLAYETVAQLVDMALLVRHDKELRAGEPLSRYIPGIGYSIRHSLDSRQIETAPALTPGELREAMRRYWNSPVGPNIAFARNTESQFDSRLLCC